MTNTGLPGPRPQATPVQYYFSVLTCVPRSLLLCWPGKMNKAKRISAYVKAKDEKHGLKVVSWDRKMFKINVLNYLFRAIFGREGEVSSNRKKTTNVQAWH